MFTPNAPVSCYHLLMKILLTLTSVLVIGIFYAYPFYRATKVSMQMEERTTPYEQSPTNPSMKILIAGDSTGVGTGATEAKDSTSGRIGSLYPNAAITNISENGLKLEGLEQKLSSVTDTYDLIVLQIGANDIVRLTSFKNIEQRAESVLTLAESRTDKVLVLTSGNIGSSPTFRWPLSALMDYRTKKVRGIFISKISNHPKASYVDLYKERKDDEFAKDPQKYYAADKFHPSSDGYAIWFERMKAVLATK